MNKIDLHATDSGKLYIKPHDLFAQDKVQEVIKKVAMKSETSKKIQDETPQLLPCPFCGNEPEWINEAIPDSHFYIRCTNCLFVMKADRRDKVIGFWNNRVGMQRYELERTEMRQLIKELIPIAEDSGSLGYLHVSEAHYPKELAEAKRMQSIIERAKKLIS